MDRVKDRVELAGRGKTGSISVRNFLSSFSIGTFRDIRMGLAKM